jgi:hypothetical protein
MQNRASISDSSNNATPEAVGQTRVPQTLQTMQKINMVPQMGGGLLNANMMLGLHDQSHRSASPLGKRNSYSEDEDHLQKYHKRARARSSADVSSAYVSDA